MGFFVIVTGFLLILVFGMKAIMVPKYKAQDEAAAQAAELALVATMLDEMKKEYWERKLKGE